MRPPHTAAAVILILSGCGYVGEPLYPLVNIPDRVQDLAAVQRGAAIVYRFTLPPLTTEGKLAKIGKVEIRAGDAGQTILLETKPDASGVVSSEIPVEPWIGKELVLAVKVYGVNGRDAGWSNLASVTVMPPLATPVAVEATAVAEGVRVSWQGPAGQYRVFRRAGDEEAMSIVASVEANQWLDTSAEYGKRYRYAIQAVRKAGSSEAESDVSATKEITPADTFSPAAPAGLNAIGATENIELVWERNTEADLAGYRVYRAEGDAQLAKIADVEEAPSYSDRKVEAGKRYRYAVSAVDRLGNESRQSEPVEIMAPR